MLLLVVQHFIKLLPNLVSWTVMKSLPCISCKTFWNAVDPSSSELPEGTIIELWFLLTEASEVCKGNSYISSTWQCMRSLSSRWKLVLSFMIEQQHVGWYRDNEWYMVTMKNSNSSYVHSQKANCPRDRSKNYWWHLDLITQDDFTCSIWCCLPLVNLKFSTDIYIQWILHADQYICQIEFLA